MTYTNLWIIYNAGIALCACVKQKINYIFKIYKFLIFESRTVKLLVLNMNIIFLKIFRDLAWLAMRVPYMANYTLIPKNSDHYHKKSQLQGINGVF